MNFPKIPNTSCQPELHGSVDKILHNVFSFFRAAVQLWKCFHGGTDVFCTGQSKVLRWLKPKLQASLPLDSFYLCTICTVCHTDIAALQPHCQLAKSRFPMTEREGSGEGILSTLIKLKSLPKALSASAKHFDFAVTSPLCITPDERLFVLYCNVKEMSTTTTTHWPA